MPVVRHNQELIENHLHSEPNRRKTEISYQTLTGFLDEVNASSPGVGSYRRRYRDSANRTRYASLGRTNVVSLEEARKAAKKLKAAISLRAVDPSADKKAAKAVPTFDQFWTDQCYPYLQAHKKTAFLHFYPLCQGHFGGFPSRHKSQRLYEINQEHEGGHKRQLQWIYHSGKWKVYSWIKFSLWAWVPDHHHQSQLRSW